MTHVFWNRVHNGPSRSSMVVYFGTNQKRVCDCPLVINSNFGHILPPFRDIAGSLPRRATPPIFHPLLRAEHNNPFLTLHNLCLRGFPFWCVTSGELYYFYDVVAAAARTNEALCAIIIHFSNKHYGLGLSLWKIRISLVHGLQRWRCRSCCEPMLCSIVVHCFLPHSQHFKTRH